jgi:hypothetical protein
MIANKAKGQQSLVAKLETAGLFALYGGLAERSNAADCESANRASTTIQGFESLTRRHILINPACSANCLRGLASGKPKAGLVPTVILVASPEESKVQSDMPQLPCGMPEVWATR